jgi:hypothetical protein
LWLRDFSKQQLKGMFCFEGGRECTADEAKDHLLEALAQGKEVLPFGPPCQGFDFSGGGNPDKERALNTYKMRKQVTDPPR